MSKPAVLIAHQHLGAVGGLLSGQYDVYRLWEGPPVESAHAIRAIVMAGEFPLERELLDSLPNLGLLACFAVGYDGVDLDWAAERGVQVSNAPGVNDEDVADHALGLILSHRRDIVNGDRQVRDGGWLKAAKPLTKGLGGAKLGIVGLGKIGLALAKRAEACGMSVSWWGPREKPEEPRPRAESLESLAKGSDILAVCCKATDENRGLVSREVLEALGSDGLVVNVSRGQVIDEDAMIDLLKGGKLGGAALDVFEVEPTPAERWADVPNTVLTPHGAGATQGAVQKMVMLLHQNLGAFFAGQPLVTPVR